MSTYSYPITTANKINGKASAEYIRKAGQVVRMPYSGAYQDCTILGFRQDDDGCYWVRLARPYCFASSVGTTAPTALVGFELFETTLERLVTWEVMANSHKVEP